MTAVHRLLRGWGQYFQYGYRRRIFRTTNHYVQGRFRCFLGIEANGAAVRFDRARVCMRACKWA